MPRIAFYISSHGFGHSTREIEVINNLPESVDVEIITAVPQWLFTNSLHRQFDYTYLSHDIGLIQIDSVTPDIPKTLQAWQKLLNEYPALVTQEVERLLKLNTSLVVGDISPLSVSVAKNLGLQSVIIANFSWDWIFQPLVKYDAEFQIIINEISEYYKQCDLLLRSPLCGDLSVFPNIQDIPMIVRKAKHSREEMRKELGISNNQTTFLLTFGGNKYPLPKEAFQEHEDITFISFDESLQGTNNVIVVNAKMVHHPDIVNLCDGVITKLGYGVVTECIAHDVPIAYPPRADFPEFEIMEQETREFIPMTKFDENDLKKGNWSFIESLTKNVNFVHSKKINTDILNGGNQTAKILQTYLT